MSQDNNRGGGGSRENRRSLAEFLGLDTSQLAEAATPTTNREGENEWRWENPSSPEATQTVAFHGYGDGMRSGGWGDEDKRQQNVTSLEPVQAGCPGGSKGRILEPRSPAAAQSPCTLVPPACFPPRHPIAYASYSFDELEEYNRSLFQKAMAMPPTATRSKSFHLKRLSCDALETVQVIPWAVSDSNWVCAGGAAGSVRLEPARTVFVGALHGMLSAAGLATIMNDLFSGVIYAGIDTDKNKYPIGSGRVTFNNVRSYVRAISAAYVEICTDKFTKKVQVDPYLEDSMCSVCNLQQGPYFCREPVCFRYFCRSCWAAAHAAEQHKPLMRNCKSATLPTALSHHSPASSTHLSGARAADGGFNGFGNVSNDAAPSPATSGSGSACAEDAPHDWMARGRHLVPHLHYRCRAAIKLGASSAMSTLLFSLILIKSL
ncbi:cytoplasmic polyadenylation element-binding protein 1 [Danaus plexippus plexippus]|uniref:Cytoplasmic polyadenylation element-binding protein 1 n=1 Tax=Danaus plexippus plexippus TaxID=278856 RepID=A0A212EMA2_DANPL|nr:cytoplasmic polyadenylation element-binding protein 1 [Danaus plexippus plexippus]